MLVFVFVATFVSGVTMFVVRIRVRVGSNQRFVRRFSFHFLFATFLLHHLLQPQGRSSLRRIGLLLWCAFAQRTLCVRQSRSQTCPPRSLSRLSLWVGKLSTGLG